MTSKNKIEHLDSENLDVPEITETFVRYGNYNDLKKIVSSRKFFPTFISGPSGCGKTLSVKQACAELHRELVRVNITVETDEDDLIGGFRLKDGDTIWHDGPVVQALQRGAILLLDEIDLASNKIMCLQSILEGDGVFLKKLGHHVYPAPGFNVIATANTKGKGSEDGRYIGTNVLNEAFLDRFAITFDQTYPTVATESKILRSVAETLSITDDQFITNLCEWASRIRKTFEQDQVDEVIATRRLVNLLVAYSIYGNKEKALKLAVNRFDDYIQKSFLTLYETLDKDIQFGDSVDTDPMVSP